MTKSWISIIQSTSVISYPDNWDLRLIRTYRRPPFRETKVISSGYFAFLIIRTILFAPWRYELGGFHCT